VKYVGAAEEPVLFPKMVYEPALEIANDKAGVVVVPATDVVKSGLSPPDEKLVTVPDVAVAHAGAPLTTVKTWPVEPMPSLALLVPVKYIRSPVVDNGDNALKAARLLVAPVPPCAIDKAVVNPDNDVMSLLAPEAAAPRLVLAPADVVALVPPLATANVPPKVNVPDAVIGPPFKVNPVVPPEPLTLVTVPADALTQVGVPVPFDCNNCPAVPAAVIANALAPE